MTDSTSSTRRPRRPRGPYELTFWGGVQRRYKRLHPTRKSAIETAHRVLASLPNRGAHPAIILGPDCGRDGMTIR